MTRRPIGRAARKLRSAAALAAALLIAVIPVSGRAANLPTTAPIAGEGSTAARPMQADFGDQAASNDARRIADWALSSQDNADLPFVIIDKTAAKVFVFNRLGTLLGASLALLGMAHGDDSVPGIGDRKLSAIPPRDRTTPAGRFVASLGRDLKTDILWVDYKDAISLHRVINGAPSDRRLQRLATASPLDKRITFGCINVPVRFYEGVVKKAFTGTVGIVYILPETKALERVFAIGDARAPGR